MSFLHDNVFDDGLQQITNSATRLDICSSEPSTYAEATSTHTLGNKTGVTVGAPEDRAGGGRKVAVPSISGGNVTADGTANYWALTNGSDKLYAAGSLSSSQSVVSGNKFDLGSFDIGIPDPA